MLNPSAAGEMPANYPAQDYGRLFDHTRDAGSWRRRHRVLAGARCRAPPSVIDCEPGARPIGSPDYDADSIAPAA